MGVLLQRGQRQLGRRPEHVQQGACRLGFPWSGKAGESTRVEKGQLQRTCMALLGTRLCGEAARTGTPEPGCPDLNLGFYCFLAV